MFGIYLKQYFLDKLYYWEWKVGFLIISIPLNLYGKGMFVNNKKIKLPTVTTTIVAAAAAAATTTATIAITTTCKSFLPYLLLKQNMLLWSKLEKKCFDWKDFFNN